MVVEEDSWSGWKEGRGESSLSPPRIDFADRQSAVGLSTSRKPNSPLCVAWAPICDPSPLCTSLFFLS